MTDYCNDAGSPGCLTVADPAWVMQFDDIGMPPIHWCSACGPGAHEVDRELMRRLEDPGFARRFQEVIEAMESDRRVDA